MSEVEFGVESGVGTVIVTGVGIGCLYGVFFSFSFKWGPFPLFLLLFRFVEVSICLQLFYRWLMFFSYFFLFVFNW